MCLASLSIQFILWQESSLDRTCRFMFSNQNVKILKIWQIENFTNFSINFTKWEATTAQPPPSQPPSAPCAPRITALRRTSCWACPSPVDCCWRNISRYMLNSPYFFLLISDLSKLKINLGGHCKSLKSTSRLLDLGSSGSDHLGILFLTSLNFQLFKNTAYVGYFWHFVIRCILNII